MRDGHSVDEVDDLLNRQSGLLGVSGISDDTRDVLPAMHDGNAEAKLAIEIYGERVRQAIGASIATLGGVDAVFDVGRAGQRVARISQAFDWRAGMLRHPP
ncbi:hypothetical protein FYK55_01445 [Roseiconus nitratireducens]|uniref:Uncharacterized protein n=1 Tax=Roseiconus nitratireducens TaxID=2605748 RepID=A0A5M6DLK0_9BACT|nr:hypothetical protein FYK55_01445 [Roseiconus nitratireducens]